MILILFCCFCPLLGLVVLNESSPDPERATVMFINSKPTQNGSGVADEVEKCFSERECGVSYSLFHLTKQSQCRKINSSL